MNEAEFYERFDARLERLDGQLERQTAAFERQNAAFERQNATFDRQAEAFERFAKASERHAAAFEGLREFIRDITRRNEIVLQAVTRELTDLSDQTRANTQAVLRVLDQPA